MKLLQDMEDAPNQRKFIKSQVEKRRRERMNRSLECLRTMLLQEPQQLGGTQHRVEKAEILEHTVLFLQNTVKGDNTRAGGGGGGGGGQKHSFQDGISTCLQRAAHFLGPEGKGLWLGAALDASFAARFSRSDSDSAGVQRRTEAQSSSSSLPHTKSLLRMLRQKSKHRLHSQAFSVNSFAHPYPLPVQHGFPRIPQQPQRQNELEIRVEGQAGKQSPSQSHPVSQTVWRPWP
ncbi:transcription factor HES-7.1-A-like [Morone saxatilis]|uniref:transcription factor HES-7.1-A-like n=1 Tax=Morone saxatilis TaxID=34816 RepID=UPI0015E22C3B|nr:transcription factor HES-7.1-A-like [Morone saxatilis]